MAAYFLDSSAAAKLYVREAGSSWMTQLVVSTQRHELFIVRVTAVEIAAAIFRRVKAGTLSADDAIGAEAALRRDLIRTFHVIEFNIPVAELAVDFARRHGLRGYDCVQLAAAVAVHRVRLSEHTSPVTLVSADLELNAAARAEGLEMSNPNDHP